MTRTSFFSTPASLDQYLRWLLWWQWTHLWPSWGTDREVLHASFVCSLSIVTSTAMVYMEAIFRSAEKAQYVALTYVLENLLRVIVCVWLLLHGYGIVVLFTAILGSRLFGFVVMSCFYVKRFGVPRGKLNLDVWRILTKEAPTFTSIAIFSTIHLSIAQIMLSKLQSMEAVGIFGAADRLLAICKTVPVAFSSALLPFFAKQFASGVEELRKLSIDSLRWLFVGAFPVVVGISILADNIIALIYGQKFSSAGMVLRFHILSLDTVHRGLYSGTGPYCHGQSESGFDDQHCCGNIEYRVELPSYISFWGNGGRDSFLFLL